MVGDDAGQSHPQPVLQGDDGIVMHPLQPMHIGAEAAGVHGADVAAQIVLAVVEIVIAQGEEIVARAVHDPGRYTGRFQAVLMQIISKGAAL